jgi:hypothetical protein
MPRQNGKHLKRRDVIAFLTEVLVYTVFVLVYYWLVLHFSGGWLKRLFDEHRIVYAVVALVLILIQGAMLEALTAGLFRIIRRKTR